MDKALDSYLARFDVWPLHLLVMFVDSSAWIAYEETGDLRSVSDESAFVMADVSQPEDPAQAWELFLSSREFHKRELLRDTSSVPPGGVNPRVEYQKPVAGRGVPQVKAKRPISVFGIDGIASGEVVASAYSILEDQDSVEVEVEVVKTSARVYLFVGGRAIILSMGRLTPATTESVAAMERHVTAWARSIVATNR